MIKQYDKLGVSSFLTYVHYLPAQMSTPCTAEVGLLLFKSVCESDYIVTLKYLETPRVEPL